MFIDKLFHEKKNSFDYFANLFKAKLIFVVIWITFDTNDEVNFDEVGRQLGRGELQLDDRVEALG